MTRERLADRPHVLLTVLVFVTLIVVYSILGRYYPLAFMWLTFEDLYNEWAEVFLLLVTMVLSVGLATGPYRYRWFFGFLALACLFVAGEEISWGQRIFDFDTPEFFRTHNLQAEANIHNLVTGPYATTMEAAVSWILAVTLTLYGLVYPLTLRAGWKLSSWTNQRLRIPAPPVYLGPFFVTAAWLELTPLNLNDNEIAEILITVALAIMALQYWATRKDSLTPTVTDRTISSRLALQIMILLAVSAVFSVAVVYSTTLDEDNRAEKERRMLISMKDFGLRLEARDWWKPAISMYAGIVKQQPYNSEVLRHIAKIYKKLGDEAQFTRYNKKAVDTAGVVYAAKPKEVPAILNLARAYQQQGDTETAATLAKRAYRFARAEAEKSPNDASALYWFGETYVQGGYYELALEQFRKAYELEPAKYRRAYLDLKLQMEQDEQETPPEE